MKVEFTAMYSEGATVIVEQRFRATLVNHRNYDNDYCFVFKVRDGRICEIREYMDTLSGFRQIFGEDAVGPISAIVA